MKLIKWSAISLVFIIAFLGIMFLHFFIITEGDYKVEQTVEQNSSLPHTHIGTTVLHSETFGSDTREVIIVLHGGPGLDFRYLLPLQKLADEYFVVFYDQRGTGLSPRVGVAELTIEEMKCDLHQMVQTYASGRKVNLIGHSWGALLAAIYANSYPYKVHKVVIAEPWTLPRQVEYGIRKSGLFWFESLHVNKPDRHAASDYFLYARIQGCQDSEQKYSKYWRYGSQARKTLLTDPYCGNGQMDPAFLNSLYSSDKILYIVGAQHSVPMENHLINLMDITNVVRKVAIENTDQLFGDSCDAFINEIRKFLNE